MTCHEQPGTGSENTKSGKPDPMPHEMLAGKTLELTIPGKLPGKNTTYGVSLHKLIRIKHEIQEKFLSVLEATARDPETTDKAKKNSISIASGMLACYLMTRKKRSPSSASRKSKSPPRKKSGYGSK